MSDILYGDVIRCWCKDPNHYIIKWKYDEEVRDVVLIFKVLIGTDNNMLELFNTPRWIINIDNFLGDWLYNLYAMYSNIKGFFYRIKNKDLILNYELETLVRVDDMDRLKPVIDEYQMSYILMDEESDFPPEYYVLFGRHDWSIPFWKRVKWFCTGRLDAEVTVYKDFGLVYDYVYFI